MKWGTPPGVFVSDSGDTGRHSEITEIFETAPRAQSLEIAWTKRAKKTRRTARQKTIFYTSPQSKRPSRLLRHPRIFPSHTNIPREYCISLYVESVLFARLEAVLIFFPGEKSGFSHFRPGDPSFCRNIAHCVYMVFVCVWVLIFGRIFSE